MVSALIANTQMQYGFTDNVGNFVVVHKGYQELWGRGGSSDGAIATALSANASPRIPLVTGRALVAKAGNKVNLRFKIGTSDGVDKSDCVLRLPGVLKDLNTGAKRKVTLVGGDLGTLTDLPASSTTDQWFLFGDDGYEVPAGSEFALGGDIIFASIENDTA